MKKQPTKSAKAKPQPKPAPKPVPDIEPCTCPHINLEVVAVDLPPVPKLTELTTKRDFLEEVKQQFESKVKRIELELNVLQYQISFEQSRLVDTICEATH